MPIITLYGSKGGSGRTTAAAMIAQGLVAHGINVTLVETTQHGSPQPLKRWFEEAKHKELGDQLQYAHASTPEGIDTLFHSILDDEQNFIAVDTGCKDTEVRRWAFSVADAVVMPFTGRLEAARGIDQLQSHIAEGKTVFALDMFGDAELAKSVRRSLPVFDTALSREEHFRLFSEPARRLTTELLSEDQDPYGIQEGPVAQLFDLATDVRGAVIHHRYCGQKRNPAPAFSPEHKFELLPDIAL